MRIDLHLHTAGSHDCLVRPEAALERARARGVHRIAITDHDRLGVARRLAQRHPGEVIPGEEVKTAEGVDVIGLYLREEIPGGTPAEETCWRIRTQGGLVYLPHPYARGKGGGGALIPRILPWVDVVEVRNGRLRPRSLNARAEALARAEGLPAGAGSDAHTRGEGGGCWVEVPEHPNEPEALRTALAGAVVGGRTAPPWVVVASTWAKVRQRLPGFVPPEGTTGAAGDPDLFGGMGLRADERIRSALASGEAVAQARPRGVLRFSETTIAKGHPWRRTR